MDVLAKTPFQLAEDDILPNALDAVEYLQTQLESVFQLPLKTHDLESQNFGGRPMRQFWRLQVENENIHHFRLH